MRVEKFLDLPRVDVLAAADHHVLDSPGDGQITVGIHDGEVTGVHPVRGVNRFGGLVRLRPVAEHHRITASAQLARRTPGHGHAGRRVDDLDLQVRSDATHRRGAAVQRIVGAGLGRYRRGLGHAVADRYLAHRHARHDLLHHLDRARRARHDAGAQAGQVVVGEPGRGQLGDEHRRHAVQRGAAFGLYGFQGRGRIEAGRGDDHARAVAGGREIAHDHAEAMVEGHRNADPVCLGVVTQLADEEAVVENVMVRERRALRETGGTGGVLDVDGVIGVELNAVEDRTIQPPPALQQRLPFRAADQHDMRQIRTSRPHLGDHARVVGRLQTLGRDEQRGARLIEHELELAGAVGRVDVDQDGADLRRRVLGERPFRAVRRPDTDPVTLLDADFQQPERQGIDVGGQFRIGPAPSGRPVDERFTAGEPHRRRVEAPPDRVAQQGRCRFTGRVTQCCRHGPLTSKPGLPGIPVTVQHGMVLPVSFVVELTYCRHRHSG